MSCDLIAFFFAKYIEEASAPRTYKRAANQACICDLPLARILPPPLPPPFLQDEPQRLLVSQDGRPSSFDIETIFYNIMASSSPINKAIAAIRGGFDKSKKPKK